MCRTSFSYRNLIHTNFCLALKLLRPSPFPKRAKFCRFLHVFSSTRANALCVCCVNRNVSNVTSYSYWNILLAQNVFGAMKPYEFFHQLNYKRLYFTSNVAHVLAKVSRRNSTFILIHSHETVHAFSLLVSCRRGEE